MYSISDEWKSIYAEKFVKTLKSQTCKYITLVWKIVYMDKLADVFNKCNNKDHSAIEIKPVGVKPSTYTDLVTI